MQVYHTMAASVNSFKVNVFAHWYSNRNVTQFMINLKAVRLWGQSCTSCVDLSVLPEVTKDIQPTSLSLKEFWRSNKRQSIIYDSNIFWHYYFHIFPDRLFESLLGKWSSIWKMGGDVALTKETGKNRFCIKSDQEKSNLKN